MAKAPSKIERSLATASSVYTFWPLLPAGLVGVVTGYLSSTVGWINDLGWFGWWSASLLGCLMASGIYFAIGAGRQKWEIAKQIK